MTENFIAYDPDTLEIVGYGTDENELRVGKNDVEVMAATERLIRALGQGEVSWVGLHGMADLECEG